MGQMWCANTLPQCSQPEPRVQSTRPVFVRAEWHGDLWSVKPPCLWRIPAFTSVFPVFNSVAWWHTVPVSLEMVLWALWQRTGRGSFHPSKEGKQSYEWEVRTERESESPCFVTVAPTSHFLTPRRPHCLPGPEGRGHCLSTLVQSCWSQDDSQSTMLPFLKLAFFLKGKTQDTLARLCLFQTWVVFGIPASWLVCCLGRRLIL